MRKVQENWLSEEIHVFHPSSWIRFSHCDFLTTFSSLLFLLSWLSLVRKFCIPAPAASSARAAARKIWSGDLWNSHTPPGSLCGEQDSWRLVLPKPSPKVERNLYFSSCYPHGGGYSAFLPSLPLFRAEVGATQLSDTWAFVSSLGLCEGRTPVWSHPQGHL